MVQTQIQQLPLNKEQQAAAFSQDQTILVLAGAGTGKTRVLTARVCHLLETGVSPRQIHAFTFTNKAAAELRKRLRDLVVGKHNRRVGAGTFHAFYYRILDRWASKVGYQPGISIFDDQDKNDVIAAVCEDLGFKPGKILKALKSKADLEADGLSTVMDEYWHRMITYNAIDFDRMQELSVQLLRDHPEALEDIRTQAKHILVDEYQDTDPKQAEFLELLQPTTLFLVGDDYQAIYGFRGADVQILLDFKKKHPATTEITLKQNYRSTNPILKAANRLIKYNTNRTEKELVSHNDSDGPDIEATISRDPRTEAKTIAKTITDLHDKNGIDYGDITILARTNAHIGGILEHGILPAKIPVQAITADRTIWRTDTSRGFLYYLRAIINPRDYQAHAFILNWPFNRIDLGTLTFLRRIMARDDLDLFTAAKETATEPLEDFLENYYCIRARNENEGPPVDELIREIAEATHLVDDFQKRRLTGRLRDFEDFWNRIETWVAERKDEEPVDARAFIAYYVGITVQDSICDDVNAIKAMTVHSAKGLEFPTVIIAGATEGQFPHHLALKEGTLEEERRLFYVAITRAETRLHLNTFKTKTNDYRPWEPPKPVAHSRFLDEALGRPQVH